MTDNWNPFHSSIKGGNEEALAAFSLVNDLKANYEDRKTAFLELGRLRVEVSSVSPIKGAPDDTFIFSAWEDAESGLNAYEESRDLRPLEERVGGAGEWYEEDSHGYDMNRTLEVEKLLRVRKNLQVFNMSVKEVDELIEQFGYDMTLLIDTQPLRKVIPGPNIRVDDIPHLIEAFQKAELDPLGKWHATPPENTPVVSAMAALTTAIVNDPGYGWTWQCNLAMAIMDSTKVTHRQANEAAADIMYNFFGVNVHELDEWIALFGVDDVPGDEDAATE